MTEEIKTPEPTTIGRRTVITSAAWSIPAVAIAVTSSASSTVSTLVR